MGTEKALIFGSAACSDWSFLQPLRAAHPLVICADGGIHLARAAGFRPDFYIGDNDSGGEPETGLACEILPAEKDLTDLQAAYQACLRRGIRDLTFTACTGGRQDHHLANLLLLERAWEAGVRARIVDPQNEIMFLPQGEHQFCCNGFRYFGIVPLDRKLEGVCIRHAKYEIENATVLRGDSLTISNEPCGVPVTVQIGTGHALLILAERIE